MRSHEAIQRAINGKTVDHAKKLGLATVTVNKWQEPSTDFTDSGAYNPLDRIETIMETGRTLGNTEGCLAPLHYLAQKFNQIVIPAPTPNKALSDLHQELSKITKEFGDLLSTSGERFADGEVSGRDAIVIKKEAYELQQALASFLAKVEQASKNQ